MLDEVKVERARTATAGRAHIRFVTATSLFDGHDAAINIMRHLLQQAGVEVIHLGHNRSVDEIVTAAIQEDVQGIAVSSSAAIANENLFAVLMDAARCCSLGQITTALYEVGGQYRRNM